MYHYVREIKNSKYKNIRGLELKKFQNQINFFLKKFNIINNDDLSEILFKKKKFNKPFLLLTFDDGYSDHYKYVFPYLKKKKISGCFYPPTIIFEREKLLDVNKIHFILEKKINPAIIIKEIRNYLVTNSNVNPAIINNNNINLKCNYDDRNTVLIKRLLQYYIPELTRKNLLNFLFKKIVNVDEKSLADELYIKRKHIIEMKKEGMHFGIHGHSHSWFTNTSNDKINKELIKSNNFFKKLKIKNLSICYPYGGVNDQIINIAKKFNYEFGLTTKKGIINLDININKLNLPRIDIADVQDII
jgi:peptidoglycan/xylan/chitin deacetylase (PgdA/CDA1 family)